MKCHLVILFLGLTLTMVGCSNNKRLTIKGSVSYQGRPVAAGIVKFHSPGDHLEMAYVRDGAFSITDVPPGEVQVTVEPQGKGNEIPRKYSDLKSSPLVYTITPKTRELAITLE